MKKSHFILMVCVIIVSVLAFSYRKTTRIGECKKPNKKWILAQANQLVQQNHDTKLMLPHRLKNLDSLILLSGQFSSNQYPEYLALCVPQKSYFPCGGYSPHLPPVETANFLLLKMSCQKEGKWQVDWFAQENMIRDSNLVDLNNDGLKELIFKDEAVCRGGIKYGFYYIQSLKNDTSTILYANNTFDKLMMFPFHKTRVAVGDTIVKRVNVSFKDVNQDGIQEIEEVLEYAIYQGGKTHPQAEKLVTRGTQKKLLYLKEGHYRPLH